MKIQQLLDNMTIFVSNEEKEFINRSGIKVNVPSLNEHDKWLAQNLVRKGVYTISKDKGYIVKVHNEETAKSKNIIGS